MNRRLKAVAAMEAPAVSGNNMLIQNRIARPCALPVPVLLIALQYTGGTI
jgi:hypothetical protein